MKYFSDFSQETGFDISCKLSAVEILHEMSNPIFWEKDEKNTISLSSAEFAHTVVNVNLLCKNIETIVNYLYNWIFLSLY